MISSRLKILILLVCINAFWGPVSADTRQAGSVFEKLLSDSKTKPITIVCLGDSVTGIYYHTGSRRAYSSLIQAGLRKMYPGISINVINAGISGNTAGAGFQRMQTLLDKYKPQLVTIMFGLNDLATRYPIESYKSILSKMVDLAKQNGAEIAICTPNSVIETSRRPRAVVARYAQAVREVAEEKNIPLADIFTAFEQIRNSDDKQWNLLFSDGEIHPDMFGHQVIAQEIIFSLTGQKKSIEIANTSEVMIPRTIAKIKAGKPVKILAMEPYDKILPKVISQICPNAKIEIESWPTKGKSVEQLMQDVEKRRGKEFWKSSINADLVVIAIPKSGYKPKWFDNLNVISQLLCYAFVFDPLKSDGSWDVVGVSGNLLDPGRPQTANELLFANLLKSRDTITISRGENDSRKAFEIIHDWFAIQFSKFQTD